MGYEQRYEEASRKLRLLSALDERQDVNQQSLSADMLESAVASQEEGLVRIMDSGLILMLPDGKEALNNAVKAFQEYTKNL
ncbi:MAG: hypothetical protein KKB21_02725 [Nanoarchaeota archaeon]|nr:hypothetical protein [Nanoarchaeota archaeon]MBU4086469.1 hypothetical protein [Nanoarchaeota archaeon]